MSATMARKGSREQLKQFNILQPWNMVKMAKGGFSRNALEETQYLITEPGAEVPEEMTRGVEDPEHIKRQAAIV